MYPTFRSYKKGCGTFYEKCFRLMSSFSTRHTVTSKTSTNKSHLNRKLETRNCCVGGNSEHSDIHCAHDTVAGSTAGSRCELSYLAPLGSENISAPYFKQCFFRGGGLLPPRQSNTTPPSPKTEITNILFYKLNFASNTRKSGYNMYRGWTQIEYQNKHYDTDQKDEGT